MRRALATTFTAMALAVPVVALAQATSGAVPAATPQAQPVPMQPASQPSVAAAPQAQPVQTPQTATQPVPAQKPRKSSPILNEDADIDKEPPPVPFFTWLYDLVFKVRRPDDPSYTLRAPFIRPKDLKTPTAIRMGLPFGEDVEGENGTGGLSVAHRSEDQVGGWLIGRVSDILDVKGTDWTDHQKMISSLMTKPALDSYVGWMNDSNILGRIVSANQHIHAYVDDAPLLLNQGAVDGRYRWLYEVHATLTFLANTTAAYVSQGGTPIDMGQSIKLVIQAQIGRVAEIDAADNAWDDDPSHHITASKLGIQPLNNSEGLALESWSVKSADYK